MVTLEHGRTSPQVFFILQGGCTAYWPTSGPLGGRRLAHCSGNTNERHLAIQRERHTRHAWGLIRQPEYRLHGPPCLWTLPRRFMGPTRGGDGRGRSSVGKGSAKDIPGNGAGSGKHLGIYRTSTAGSDWKSNSKWEAEDHQKIGRARMSMSSQAGLERGPRRRRSGRCFRLMWHRSLKEVRQKKEALKEREGKECGDG